MIVRTVLSLSVSLAVAMTANAALKDGTYTEDTLGHNSPVTVKVTIQGGKSLQLTALQTWKLAESVSLP